MLTFACHRQDNNGERVFKSLGSVGTRRVWSNNGESLGKSPPSVEVPGVQSEVTALTRHTWPFVDI